MEAGHYRSIIASTGVTPLGAILRVLSRPIEVVRFGFITTSAIGAPLTVQFGRRPTPSSVVGQTSFNLAMTAAGQAIGMMTFMDLEDPLICYPGQELSMGVTVTGVSGTIDQFIVYLNRGFHKRNDRTPYYGKLVDAAPGNG